MSLIRRGIRLILSDGIRGFLREGVLVMYKHVRNFQPTTVVSYNNVQVRAGRTLDGVIPGFPENRPDYESAIVSSLISYTDPGDIVVIVGGGWGVTATVAAERCAPSGSVIVYEASSEKVTDVQETAKINGVEETINVKHRIVGEEISLFGERGDATLISGNELPNCNILVLDCEGAERTILQEYEDRPSTIIVETHGFLGAPREEVEYELKKLGYTVQDCRVAEESSREYCEENGIYVLTASLSGR